MSADKYWVYGKFFATLAEAEKYVAKLLKKGIIALIWRKA